MIVKKIAIITGGPGEERGISMLSADNVGNALKNSVYQISRYDLPENLSKLLADLQNRSIDLAIPIIHGDWGEDGRLPALLDIFKVPYLFSNHLTSAVAMDKNLTKKILSDKEIIMAPWILWKKVNNVNLDKLIADWQLPIVVKPNASGSSCGIVIAKTKAELEVALEEKDEVLLEKFIKGRELTVAVTDVGGAVKALPIIEIISKVSEWFDYKAKYSPQGSDEICPAQIPDNVANQLKEIAMKVFRVLNCRDLARVDFIWSQDDDKLYFLEINTVPGMTKASLCPKALQVAGLSLIEFFSQLIMRRLE